MPRLARRPGLRGTVRDPRGGQRLDRPDCGPRRRVWCARAARGPQGHLLRPPGRHARGARAADRQPRRRQLRRARLAAACGRPARRRSGRRRGGRRGRLPRRAVTYTNPDCIFLLSGVVVFDKACFSLGIQSRRRRTRPWLSARCSRHRSARRPNRARAPRSAVPSRHPTWILWFRAITDRECSRQIDREREIVQPCPRPKRGHGVARGSQPG